MASASRRNPPGVYPIVYPHWQTDYRRPDEIAAINDSVTHNPDSEGRPEVE